MLICNVIEIYDIGEFVTIVTSTGTSVHLPMEMKHSITIEHESSEDTTSMVNVTIDLNQGA